MSLITSLTQIYDTLRNVRQQSYNAFNYKGIDASTVHGWSEDKLGSFIINGIYHIPSSFTTALLFDKLAAPSFGLSTGGGIVELTYDLLYRHASHNIDQYSEVFIKFTPTKYSLEDYSYIPMLGYLSINHDSVPTEGPYPYPKIMAPQDQTCNTTGEFFYCTDHSRNGYPWGNPFQGDGYSAYWQWYRSMLGHWHQQVSVHLKNTLYMTDWYTDFNSDGFGVIPDENNDISIRCIFSNPPVPIVNGLNGFTVIPGDSSNNWYGLIRSCEVIFAVIKKQPG
jgi:hypothetical protein